MKRGIGLSILYLCLILAAFPVGSSRDVRAQTGPPDASLVVKVSTDKTVYAPGEAVRIRVQVTNLLGTEQLLQFGSSLQADYVLNGAYRWSAGRGFLTVLTSLRLAPGATHQFPEFVHEASAHMLEPGRRHEITGEVAGYGRAGTIIFVSSDGTPSKFELTPSVRPNPAPFGEAIHFSISVRNTTDQPLTFGHDGCPVQFRIDGRDMPPVACAEYWKQVTLQPGESVRFGPEDYGYLKLGPGPNGQPLPPGPHQVDFEIRGVGAASARFQVLAGTGGGAITGRVSDVDGTVVAGATIQAFHPSVTESSSLNTAFATFQAYSGRDGNYRLDNIPAGRYLVRAFTSNSNTIWFKQVEHREQATPVPVTDAGVTPAIDFVLKTGPEPPVNPGIIFGSVHESSDRVDAALPLHNAVVAAFPLRPGDLDSDAPPPGSTLPPLPPEGPGVYFGFADDAGDFHISVPYGTYRLIAFAEGYRYQWFYNAETLDKATTYTTSPNARQAPARFVLARIVPATAPARMAGSVFGESLTAAGTAVLKPLAGAAIAARPLVLDPRIAYFREVVYETRSADDGSYGVDVPPTIPYIVEARQPGYRAQFYNHAASHADARPLDVFAGRTTGGIRFDLRADDAPPPPRPGVISGFVYSDNGTDGPLRPLAGAVVRIRNAGDLPVPAERITRTDVNGRYLFSGLSMASDTSPRYIVSADADGHVPAYYPGVYQWTTAQPVEPVPAEARIVTNLTLYQPIGQTPWFSVGYVRARHETGVPPADDGDSTGPGSGTVIPGEAQRLIDRATTGPASHGGPHPLPGAYFYLVRGDAAAGEAPMAGGVTSQNGTVVVGNLQPGVYRAYADRPGFLVGRYGGPDGAGLITVGEGQRPVLADILMSLQFPPPGSPVEDVRNRVVRDLHNAPNPARPLTTIMYQLETAADVTLKIFDVNGRLVRTLVDRARQFPGQQTVAWDGRDGLGGNVGAGIYFYRVETPAEATVGKMVLAR